MAIESLASVLAPRPDQLLPSTFVCRCQHRTQPTLRQSHLPYETCGDCGGIIRPLRSAMPGELELQELLDHMKKLAPPKTPGGQQ